ncbi:MAG TPA: helix-hairpin-helix domain-containing protein [Bacteroidales bacterium]|nr:helix-hairpin-helix domain-containing protein [Bacteroidales bacterium]
MQTKKKRVFLSGLQRFFDFSTTERRGLFVLLIVLLLIIVFRISLPYFIEKRDVSKSLNDDVKRKVDAFYARQLFIKDSLNEVYKKTYSEKTVNFYNIDQSVAQLSINPFPFNPNNLSEKEWEKLGLTKQQIKSIKNYEAKGGKFYKKEDLKKMYCISEDEYTILEPYIIIPKDTTTETWNKARKSVLLSLPPIEINSCDSIDLLNIPGIGAKTASRIITYRNRLGGFVAKEQLQEIYGIDSIRYQQITPYITIDENNIKKLNINKADIKELITHPYIDYYLAKTIVQLRTNKGLFTSLEDFKTKTRIYNELYNKLIPYLTTE